MLKYQHIGEGARVRAYDYEPREGVNERFIEGCVVGHGEMPHCPGAASLIVECDLDTTWGAESYQGQAYTRIGSRVHVPMQIGDEYDGRVRVITERCDL